MSQDGALTTALFIVFTNDSYVHRAVYFRPQCSSSSRTSLMFTAQCTFYHIVRHRHERALCSQGGVLSTTMFIIVTNEPYVHSAVYFLPHCSPSSQTSPMFTRRSVLSTTLLVIVTNEPYVHMAVYFLPHCSSSSRTSPMFTGRCTFHPNVHHRHKRALCSQGGVLSTTMFIIVTNEHYADMHRAVYIVRHRHDRAL